MKLAVIRFRYTVTSSILLALSRKPLTTTELASHVSPYQRPPVRKNIASTCGYLRKHNLVAMHKRHCDGTGGYPATWAITEAGREALADYLKREDK